MASPFAIVSVPGKPTRLRLNFSESSPSREQWRKLGTDVIREYGQEAEQAIEGARQTYIKNKAAAEDVSEKMRAAVQEFIAQYVRGNRMGISEMLDFSIKTLLCFYDSIGNDFILEDGW